MHKHVQTSENRTSNPDRRTISRDRLRRFRSHQQALALDALVDLLDQGGSAITFAVKTQFHKRGWVR